MEVTIQITIGPNVYNHYVQEKVTLKLPEFSIEDPAHLGAALKLAQNNLKQSIKDMDRVAVSALIKDKRVRAEIKKELEDEADGEVKRAYEYQNKITELEKEIKKRDCRMDGVISSMNPDYIPPNEDGEPVQLGD